MKLALILLPSALLAHDMWIEPTTYFPVAGQIVGAKLRVGQDLLGDPLPRDPALLKEFVFEDSAGRASLIGHDGADPAGYLRVAAPGLVVIGYSSNPSAVELPAAKFNQYVKEEGLDAVAEARAWQGKTGAGVRELFSRCAKSLILSGAPGEKQHDRTLGFALELVAERNPYTLGANEDLPVRLTWQGRPHAGALVVAINRLNPDEKISARTDADGRVRLRLRAEGMWMIKAVHMVAAPAAAGADWMSYWASLTFERRGAMVASK